MVDLKAGESWCKDREERDEEVLGGADCPAEFGAGGSGVGALFFGGGAKDIGGDGGVLAVEERRFEGEFDATIFSRVEAENGETASWFQAFGEVAEEGIEGGELVIDGDAKGLENASDGEIDLGGGGESLEDLADTVGELGGGGEG